MIDALVSKGQLLEESGYRYNFERMVYFNRKTKKAFSVEFVDDNSRDDLQRCITEETNGEGWRFYFNTPPAESVKRQLENDLA